jgi:hypothetical protein
MTDRRKELASLGLLLCLSAGCSNHPTQPDCQIPVCPLPMAILLSVTSTSDDPVPGLTLTVSGAASGSTQCTVGESATSCYVPGMPGMYNLHLTAAGFQDETLSVAVSGTTPPCGCTSVQTQRVRLLLTPG